MSRVLWKKFGQAVHRHKVDTDMSTRELARKLSIAHMSVSRAERGLVVNAETFLILCKNLLDTDPRLYLR